MSHHHDPNQPFSIPQIRFIPEKLKPWLVILFIIVFNCTGGVYLAAVSEMVGSTQLLQEDDDEQDHKPRLELFRDEPDLGN